MAASLCRRGVIQSRAFFLRRALLSAGAAVGDSPASSSLMGLLCKDLNLEAGKRGILSHFHQWTWTMEPSCPFRRGQFLGFSTESQKKKKKKKKTKRGIIKKLKQLRYVTKIKKANMDHEQKLQARIERAKKKIDELQKALEDYKLPPLPMPEHDPESLTAEELHYLKRLGYKHKNYLIIGVRGVFGGVVLNMHLHWKKHQLIKIRCKNFTKEEINETGEQLARLSGGIVVDVQKGNTIVMYRGRNYKRPADIIPKNTLSKRKALFKAKFEQSLESMNKNLLALERELVLYREHKAKEEAGLFSGEPADGYISSWSDAEDDHLVPPVCHSDSEEVDVDPALVCDSDSVLDTDTDTDSLSESDSDPHAGSDSDPDTCLGSESGSDFSMDFKSGSEEDSEPNRS